MSSSWEGVTHFGSRGSDLCLCFWAPSHTNGPLGRKKTCVQTPVADECGQCSSSTWWPRVLSEFLIKATSLFLHHWDPLSGQGSPDAAKPPPRQVSSCWGLAMHLCWVFGEKKQCPHTILCFSLSPGAAADRAGGFPEDSRAREAEQHCPGEEEQPG